MPSIPELTRLLAAILAWQNGHGQPRATCGLGPSGNIHLAKAYVRSPACSYGAGGRVRAAPPWPLRGWGGLGASPGLLRHAALSRAKHRQAAVMRLQQRLAKSLAVQRRRVGRKAAWPTSSSSRSADRPAARRRGRRRPALAGRRRADGGRTCTTPAAPRHSGSAASSAVSADHRASGFRDAMMVGEKPHDDR